MTRQATAPYSAEVGLFLDGIRTGIIDAMAEQGVLYADISRQLHLSSVVVWQRITDPPKVADWTMHELAELQQMLGFRWPDPNLERTHW